MTFQNLNRFRVLPGAAIGAGDTTITMAAGSSLELLHVTRGLPFAISATNPFRFVIEHVNTGAYEVCESQAPPIGEILQSVTRGLEGTTAVAWADTANTRIASYLTADVLDAKADTDKSLDQFADVTQVPTKTLAINDDTTLSGGTHSGTNTGNQTITNSSDATSHTVTLSASGGSVQLIEGANISLTTGGTASAGTVTIAASGGGGISDGDTLVTGLTFPNTGLHILDTNATHDLIVAPGSDLTADRTLTLTTGDADRSLTIGASASVSGSNTGDVSLAGTPDYITITGQTITRNAVDLAADVTGDLPFANITPATAASKLLGRGDSGAGDLQEISVGSGLTMTGTTLSASGGAGGWTDDGTTVRLTTATDDVAIGTATAVSKLTVEDDIAVVDSVFIKNINATGRGLRVRCEHNAAQSVLQVESPGTDIISARADGDVFMEGRLKIGASAAPIYALDVEGQQSLVANIASDAAYISNTYGGINPHLATGLTIRTGVSATANILKLQGQAGWERFYFNGQGDLVLYRSTSPAVEWAKFDAVNQRLGVGAPSPTEALDVVGTGKFTGDIKSTVAGKGLFIKEWNGTPATAGKMGQATLVAGTVTVSTTSVSASSRIFLTCAVAGGTQGFLSVGTITAATSFVINSTSGTDTSTINWIIIDPA